MRKIKEAVRVVAGYTLLALAIVSAMGVVVVAFWGIGAYPGFYLLRFNLGLGLILGIAGWLASLMIAGLIPCFLFEMAGKCWGVTSQPKERRLKLCR